MNRCVFVLLDGETTLLEVFPVAGRGHPIDLVPLLPVPFSVEVSFRNGSFAIHNAWWRIPKKIRRSLAQHTILAYRIDKDVTPRIFGGSGALPFAIAVMFGMLKMPIPENIGATGAIVNIASGRIDPVINIEKKLQAAFNAKCLDIIFYPSDNETDIPNYIKAIAVKNDIILKPIEKVDEVIEYYVGKSKRLKWYVILLLLALLSYILLGTFFHTFFLDAYNTTSLPKVATPSVSPLQRMPGSPIRLSTCIYSLLGFPLCVWSRVFFWNGDLRRLCENVTTPLHTIVQIRLLRPTGESNAHLMRRSPVTLSLTKRDLFGFRLTYTSEPIYAYLYQFDNDGAVSRRYPSTNSMPPLVTTSTIPPGGHWFNLHGGYGKTDIAIVLSRWRCKDLERLSAPGEITRYLESIETQALATRVMRMRLRTP